MFLQQNAVKVWLIVTLEYVALSCTRRHIKPVAQVAAKGSNQLSTPLLSAALRGAFLRRDRDHGSRQRVRG